MADNLLKRRSTLQLPKSSRKSIDPKNKTKSIQMNKGTLVLIDEEKEEMENSTLSPSENRPQMFSRSPDELESDLGLTED